MTSASPCPKTIHTSPGDFVDVDLRTPTLMRDTLTTVAETGWDSPAGDQLLAALRHACTTVTLRVERARRLTHDPARCDDLLSHAWELVHQHRDDLLRADNPWGYLTTCLQHVLVSLIVADTLHVTPNAVRNGTAARAGIHPPVRLDTTTLDDGFDRLVLAPPTNTTRDAWDRGLLTLHAELVNRGAPADITATAIDRIADIAAATRRGHRESAVATDLPLHQLGLTPDQARALLGLLIGGRTDNGTSSLWLRCKRSGSDAIDATDDVTARRTAAYLTPFAQRAVRAA